MSSDKNHGEETSSFDTTPVYGELSKNLHLPFFKPVHVPAKDPSTYPWGAISITDSCAFKIVSGGVIGGVLGVALGIFMNAMGGDNNAIQILHGREVPTAPLREQLRMATKATMTKSRSMAMSFGVLSALFGGVECVIEKQRAKHDVWNPVISGCVVGATLAAKAGPQAACAGCAGFAGFSYLMDKVMGQH
jgi:mitochondrial import inner membrane translocase subunit TIM22